MFFYSFHGFLHVRFFPKTPAFGLHEPTFYDNANSVTVTQKTCFFCCYIIMKGVIIC